MSKKIEVVAAIIRDRQGRFFATERADGNKRGRWEFPGGKVEAGETHRQALVREIREELQMTIAVDDLFCSVTHAQNDIEVVLHCYFCHIVKGEPVLLEHMDACWLDNDRLNDPDWLDADRIIVNKLQQQADKLFATRSK